MSSDATRWTLATLTVALTAPDVVLGVEVLGPVEGHAGAQLALVRVPGEREPRWVHVGRLGIAVDGAGLRDSAAEPAGRGS